MEKLPHEVLVELFRERPELARELLSRCAGIELVGTATISSSDLSQISPTQYRADAVIVFEQAGVNAVAVIVEVQRSPDKDKCYSWPVYVAALRAKLRCPVTLLVIATTRAVVRWARRPIDLGHPGFRLQPIVIGFADVPRITDGALGRRLPELAVLSAFAHPQLDVARVAIDAIRELPDSSRALYSDVIISSLPRLAREILEAQMEGYKYRSDYARKYFAQGREEGLEQGLVDGLRAAVLVLAADKLGTLPEDIEARIRGLADHEILTALNRELGRARDAAEARAVIDRHVPGA